MCQSLAISWSVHDLSLEREDLVSFLSFLIYSLRYSIIMKNSFLESFKTSTPVIIGAVHLPPLPGYPEFPGFDTAIVNAIADAQALEAGGASAIIFENNYDIPHTSSVQPEVVAAMTRVGLELTKQCKIPVGISVLWNDYRSALGIAKALNLSFIRIPVFVDTVKISYGVMSGDPADVLKIREALGAEEVALFTDIHVKHAELLGSESIEVTAQAAIDNGSDALIVTGKWTGDAPVMEELKTLRANVGGFPILCGSGVDEHNVSNLFEYANGAIVSTSLKEGLIDTGQVNLKPYDDRISEAKTRALVEAARI